MPLPFHLHHAQCRRLLSSFLAAAAVARIPLTAIRDAWDTFSCSLPILSHPLRPSLALSRSPPPILDPLLSPAISRPCLALSRLLLSPAALSPSLALISPSPCVTMPVQHSQRSIRINGLSKSITLHSFNGWRCQTTVLRAVTQSEHLQEINEKHAAEIQALPLDEQEMVQIMLEDQGVDAAASSFYSPDLDGFEDVSEDSEAEEGDEFAGLSEGFSGWYIFLFLRPRFAYEFYKM
ncbi:hypothetical protein HD554DRAFT_2174221 [Boletus coccyginus]|nr:hypothetical protein HD554DRAFT_2174221 [Boletus coccyginus]